MSVLSAFDGVASNVTLTGNTVDGIARLCELRQTENVTITDNVIKNTVLHGMLLTVHNGSYTGDVTIIGNTAYGINDRFVRMAGAGDANVVIKDNNIIAYLGEDADYIKVTDSTDTPVIENNTLVSVGAKDYDGLKAAIVRGEKNIVLVNDITVDKWVMFSETKTIGTGQIITVAMNGLTIDGNGHTLTVNSIESARNGDLLFDDASNLNISNLTIKYADGLAGGINLESGVISNVTFIGGGNMIYPGTGDIKVENCTFIENGAAFYNDHETDYLTVTGCTFNLADNRNVILIRGDVKFTNNIVNSGRTVNIVSGSPVVTGNNFNNVRLKVYSAATATVSGNTINNLAFEDNATTYSSSFADNTMSAEAQAALATMTKN